MPAEIAFECLLWIQLRRSSVQPPSEPLVGLLDGCPPFRTDRQFQRFLPAAFHQFGRNEQQLVASGHRFGMHALLLDQSHKESPQVVCQEQEAGHCLAHHSLVAAKAVEGHAEFLHLPAVNLNCNQLFLEHLRSSDSQAHHVVIAHQAGFHLREGDARLPGGVHIVSLPPYSPELNPCEQLWDVLKGTEGFSNALFESMENFRKALWSGLQRFWDDAQVVLSLIGRPWLQSQANAATKI